MKSEQVQYFLEAAELGSFLKVAERHYLSQPAVSLAVSNLEKELGVQLLTRSCQGITLTEAGVLAKNYFETMAIQLQELKDKLVPYQMLRTSDQEVLLKVCVTIESNNFLVKDIMKEYYHHYPNSRFDLKEYDFIDMLYAVGQKHYDFGVFCIIEEIFENENIQSLIKINNISCRILESDHLRVVMARDSVLASKKSVSLGAVLMQPLVIYNSSEERCWHDLFLEKHHYDGKVVRTNSIGYLSDIIREKSYVAFYLNRRWNSELTDKFVIKPIKGNVRVLTGVMHRKDFEKTTEMTDFLRCLEKVIQKG